MSNEEKGSDSARETVCKVEDLPEGEIVSIKVFGRRAGCVRINGRVHVFGGVCPHHGGFLDRGRLSYALGSAGPGEIDVDWATPLVRCPWHGWEFSLRSGGAVAGDKCITIYRAEVADGHLIVEGNMRSDHTLDDARGG